MRGHAQDIASASSSPRRVVPGDRPPELGGNESQRPAATYGNSKAPHPPGKIQSCLGRGELNPDLFSRARGDRFAVADCDRQLKVIPCHQERGIQAGRRRDQRTIDAPLEALDGSLPFSKAMSQLY